MKKTGLLILVALLSSPAQGSTSAESEPVASHAVESDSKIFTMDRVYRSMFGPKSTDRVTLST